MQLIMISFWSSMLYVTLMCFVMTDGRPITDTLRRALSRTQEVWKRRHGSSTSQSVVMKEDISPPSNIRLNFFEYCSNSLTHAHTYPVCYTSKDGHRRAAMPLWGAAASPHQVFLYVLVPWKCAKTRVQRQCMGQKSVAPAAGFLDSSSYCRPSCSVRLALPLNPSPLPL